MTSPFAAAEAEAHEAANASAEEASKQEPQPAAPPAPPAAAAESTAEPPEERMCRYCFEGEEVGELISPCRCAGGQEWVHLSCLRSWQRTVLVSQPTHPDLHGNDTRQSICNVCKSEFTCAPPTRADLMTSFTGPEIAGLIEEGCVIASAEDFSWELEQQVMSFPEGMREGIVYRHWVRGAFLIVKVVEDRERREHVLLRISDEDDMTRFMDHLGRDSRSFHLRGRRFSVLSQGPLRNLNDEAPAEERRAAMRELRTPLTLYLRPEPVADCGEDGIVAVNLTRPFDLAAGHHVGRRETFAAGLREAGISQEEIQAEVTHYVAGPCEEGQISACVIVSRGKYEVVRDSDCLVNGIRVAQAVSSGALSLDALAMARGRDAAGSATAAAEAASANAMDIEEEEEDGNGSVAAEVPEDGGSPAAGAAHKRRRLAAATGPQNEAAAPSEPVRLLVFWGYAGWSRCQLMGEIARGSWGMCRGEEEDVVAAGPSQVWRKVYPRLLFAPKSEMSESYSGQAPEEEERRRGLRRMAIFHDLLRGRPGQQARGEEGGDDDEDEEEPDEASEVEDAPEEQVGDQASAEGGAGGEAPPADSSQ